MSRHDEARPPGWFEAIAAALRAAPEPSPELCEKVAALLVGRSVAQAPPLTKRQRERLRLPFRDHTTDAPAARQQDGAA
jgi:hypothetical protein